MRLYFLLNETFIMKTKTLFAHVIAELQAAGAACDTDKLSAIIRHHRIIDGKLIREANQVFRDAERKSKAPAKKRVTAAGTFARAWEIARGFHAQMGGKVSEYFNRGLVIAWQEVKLAA